MSLTESAREALCEALSNGQEWRWIRDWNLLASHPVLTSWQMDRDAVEGSFITVVLRSVPVPRVLAGSPALAPAARERR